MLVDASPFSTRHPRGQVDLAEDDVDHAVEDVVLVGHVVVERQGLDPEFLGELAHGERWDTSGVGKRNGDTQSSLPGEGLAGLRDTGRLESGQHVLIIGASGGVGTFAVQIARAFGAEVTGVCSTAKIDLVQSIGADHVIDYTQDDFADGSQRYDLILDTGGNASLSRLRLALTPSGTLVIVIVGGEGGGLWTGGFGRQLRASALSPFVRQRLAMKLPNENHVDLECLAQFVEAGDLTPVIDRAFPLHQAPDAMRHLEAGRARGKLVITVTGTG